jgi:hypothetical protein
MRKWRRRGGYITLPPWALQVASSLASVQPCPLQAFWPLHEEDAVLHALVPLHELAPLHFTPACAAVAKLPAAKITVAVANRRFLLIAHSLAGFLRCSHARPQGVLTTSSMTLVSFTVKSEVGDEA